MKIEQYYSPNPEDLEFKLNPKTTVTTNHQMTCRYTWLEYTAEQKPLGDTKKKFYWIWRRDNKQIQKVRYDEEWGGFYTHGDFIQRFDDGRILKGNFTDNRVTHWMEYFEPIQKPNFN